MLFHAIERKNPQIVFDKEVGIVQPHFFGFIVVENESQAKKVLGFKSELPNCTTFISFDPISEETLGLAKAAGVTVYLFSDVVSLGQKYRKENTTLYL